MWICQGLHRTRGVHIDHVEERGARLNELVIDVIVDCFLEIVWDLFIALKLNHHFVFRTFFFNQLQMSFQRFAKDVNPSDIRSLISSDEMHSQAMVTNRWVFFCPTKIRRCRNYFYYFSVMENTS